MYKVSILSLFFICAVTVCSACKVDCRTVLCAAVECDPGYESYTPPCECCNKCRKIINPPCEVDCKEPCPLIKCAPGYTSVKPPCKCCNECKIIETPPGSEVCETIDCNGNECPIVDCIEGYKPVRSECGCCDKCVPVKNTCGKNEVYDECGSACPKTCANLEKDQVCTKQCVEGCFCREGLVKNDYGECVEPSQCPKQECKVNCTKKHCPQIRCKKGYKLVKPKCGCCEECQKIKDTCGKDEVYNECGSACPKTCANSGKKSACTEQCVEGCFCREGLIKNDSGKCVHPNKCPKQECKVNCTKKHCPQIRCKTGYKLVKPKCGCCEECQKIKDPWKNTNEDSSSDSDSDEKY